MEFKNRHFTVVGLGVSGQAAARHLLTRGAHVHCTDTRSEAELGEAAEAVRSAGATLETGGHDRVRCLAADALVLSPGVPTAIPLVQEANRLGLPVIGEVELAGLATARRIIGITGSNGKSTVTSLTGHLLETAGLPTLTGGNLGTPLLDLIDGQEGPEPVDGWLVAELSSFQLETVRHFRPAVAVMLNLSPDHLDRHREMRVYAAAKERIFLNQGEGDAAVVNLDDQAVRAMALGSLNEGVRRLFFTAGRGKPKAGVEGAYLQEDRLTIRLAGEDLALMAAGEIPLEGRHNLSNCLAVAAVAGHLEIGPETFSKAVRGFHALSHRMEPAGTVRGIRAVDDSKATNVDATLKALAGMKPRSVLLIMGGLGKGGDFSTLTKAVAEKVKGLFLIGRDARLIAEAMDPEMPAPTFCDDLDQAVARAAAAGDEGDVLLLSPACASFDMFDSFEHRGRVFKEAVARAAAGGD